MSLYLRILAYLRPHLPVLTVTVLLTVLFAALDGFSLVLLIPFLSTIFSQGGQGGAAGTAGPAGAEAAGEVGAAGGGAAADMSTGNAWLDGLLDATLGRFVDTAGDPETAVQGIILFILVVFFLKNLVDFLRAWLTARVEQGVMRDLRDEVYDHLLELDLAFFGRTRVGQIVSRLTTDVEQLRSLVTNQLIKVLSSFFEFVAFLVLMLAISWRLTLAAFIVIPFTMGIWGPLLRKLRRGDRRVLDLAGEVNSHIQETLSGIRLVKSSAAEAHERSRFHGLTGDYFRTFVRTARLRSLAAPLTEMLAAVGTVVLLWYGAHLVLVEGTLTSAAFLGFLGLSLKLYSPVKFIAKFPATVQPGLVGAERIFEFLDAPIEIRDERGARPFPGLDDSIRFEGVSFGYREGEPVLRDVDLEVPAGSVVALVGPSGAGKTTLVDLVGRFYEPSRGRITIDGVDLREIALQSLRGNLGIVSQETVLFHDTVRANIAYGVGEVGQDEIERAARAANAHDFVTELTHGYDTVVGERGTELSGGQRQRISIARAILRDPPILIFDEATSALDTASERLVQDAIQRLLAGRTVFVIAHRLSTVQRADQIVVLDRGRVVQRGTHPELIAEGGLYGTLHEMQFADVEAG